MPWAAGLDPASGLCRGDLFAFAFAMCRDTGGTAVPPLFKEKMGCCLAKALSTQFLDVRSSDFCDGPRQQARQPVLSRSLQAALSINSDTRGVFYFLNEMLSREYQTLFTYLF